MAAAKARRALGVPLRPGSLYHVTMVQRSGSPNSSILPIVSFHAHVYYDPATTLGVAERLRERISDLFVVQLGRWHDRPVGPHVQAMYQVAFTPPVFASFVPWLILHRDGLTVLVHANTLEPFRDHTEHALWLGEKLPIKGEVLDARIEPSQQDAVTPNSRAAQFSSGAGAAATDLTQLPATRLNQTLVEKERLIRHQKIAIELLTLPADERRTLIRQARAVVERWRAENLCSGDYIDRWHSLLELSPRELAKAMTSDADGWGNALRQNSPWTAAGR